MTTSEKVAYLKGLAEGMGIDGSTNEGKLFMGIIDALDEMALEMGETKDALDDLTDSVDEIGNDLADLENEFYESPCPGCAGHDDEDGEEPVFYSVKCPGCEASVTVDEDVLRLGTFDCPECGAAIELTDENVEELDPEEDED